MGAARATFRPTGFAIVEIRGALVEIHDKSIRFSTTCTGVDHYHMSLSRIEP
jgi:hypothetical protein